MANWWDVITGAGSSGGHADKILGRMNAIKSSYGGDNGLNAAESLEKFEQEKKEAAEAVERCLNNSGKGLPLTSPRLSVYYNYSANVDIMRDAQELLAQHSTAGKVATIVDLPQGAKTKNLTSFTDAFRSLPARLAPLSEMNNSIEDGQLAAAYSSNPNDHKAPKDEGKENPAEQLIAMVAVSLGLVDDESIGLSRIENGVVTRLVDDLWNENGNLIKGNSDLYFQAYDNMERTAVQFRLNEPKFDAVGISRRVCSERGYEHEEFLLTVPLITTVDGILYDNNRSVQAFLDVLVGKKWIGREEVEAIQPLLRGSAALMPESLPLLPKPEIPRIPVKVRPMVPLTEEDSAIQYDEEEYGIYKSSKDFERPPAVESPLNPQEVQYSSDKGLSKGGLLNADQPVASASEVDIGKTPPITLYQNGSTLAEESLGICKSEVKGAIAHANGKGEESHVEREEKRREEAQQQRDSLSIGKALD